jgi:hypothetical protein
MALGNNTLSGSGDDRLDRAQRLTSPGMATWADIDNVRYCTGCAHFWRRHCQLFVARMRKQVRDPDFLGPKLPRGQRACTKFTPNGARGGSLRAPSARGDDAMASISERFPATGNFRADDLKLGDLDLQIADVKLDVSISSSAYGDVVTFGNDERRLIMNVTVARQIAALHGDETDDWPGKWVTLFYDSSVKFNDEIVGGIRVRPVVPNLPEGNGSTRPKPKPPLTDDGDAIPF